MGARATAAPERKTVIARAACLVTFGAAALRTCVRATWASPAPPSAAAPPGFDAADACRMLGRLNVRVVLSGVPVRGGGVLLVSNHVSWLDICVLATVERTRFVAKSEVAAWPIVGPVAARVGTFFIVRGSFRDAKRVKDAIAAALGAGGRVAAFPEGTTTDGSRVGRFYPALFQAALDAGAVVQPVAVRYVDEDGRRVDDAAFIDEMSFGQSLWQISRRSLIRAELTFGSPLAGSTRRELATEACAFVRQALGLGDGRRESLPRGRRAA